LKFALYVDEFSENSTACVSHQQAMQLLARALHAHAGIQEAVKVRSLVLFPTPVVLAKPEVAQK